jgi:LysR family transcriptional regulator, glycine cleavage system transcriptional activator
MNSTRHRRLPPLVALQGFEAAARHLSFTRAASELSLSQSAVSRQVILLEQWLGVELFARVRKRLVLTTAGSEYLRRIRGHLEALESATLELMTHGGEGGHLRLSVPSTFGAKWLTPRLASFVHENPHVALNLTTRPGQYDLAGDDIDAAIMWGNGIVPGCNSESVLRSQFVPVAAPRIASRLRPRGGPGAFVGAPLLHHTFFPEAWELYYSALGLKDSEPLGGPRFALMSMGAQAAIAGLGIALLPDYVVHEDLVARRLVRIGDIALSPKKAYYFVAPSRSWNARAIAAFRRWVLAAGNAPSRNRRADQARNNR